MPVSMRLDRHGEAGSSATSPRPKMARERAHALLVDPRLDERMAHAVFLRGNQAGRYSPRSSRLVPETICAAVCGRIAPYRLVLQ